MRYVGLFKGYFIVTCDVKAYLNIICFLLPQGIYLNAWTVMVLLQVWYTIDNNKHYTVSYSWI
jgi:hypothetical protein